MGQEQQPPTREEAEQWGKIAQMVIAGVPDAQIAEVFGVAASTIGDLRDHPDFKTIYAKVYAEKFETIEVMDNSWDAIEQLAMKQVIDSLSMTKDPRFALTAAMSANRAVRRKMGNALIQPQNDRKMVLHMSSVFMAQVNHNVTAQMEAGAPLKLVNQEKVVNGRSDGGGHTNGHDAVEGEAKNLQAMLARAKRKKQDFLPMHKVEDIMDNSVEGVQFKDKKTADTLRGIGELMKSSMTVAGK